MADNRDDISLISFDEDEIYFRQLTKEIEIQFNDEIKFNDEFPVNQFEEPFGELLPLDLHGEFGIILDDYSYNLIGGHYFDDKALDNRMDLFGFPGIFFQEGEEEIPDGEDRFMPKWKPFESFFTSIFGFNYWFLSSWDILRSKNWPKEWRKKENYMLIALLLTYACEDIKREDDRIKKSNGTDKEAEEYKEDLIEGKEELEGILQQNKVSKREQELLKSKEYRDAVKEYSSAQWEYIEEGGKLADEIEEMGDGPAFADTEEGEMHDKLKKLWVKFKNAESNLNWVLDDLQPSADINANNEIKDILECKITPESDLDISNLSGYLLKEIEYYRGKIKYES